MLAWQDGTPPRQEEPVNNLSLDMAVSCIKIISICIKNIYLHLAGATIISERGRKKSSLGLLNSFNAYSFSTFAFACHGNLT